MSIGRQGSAPRAPLRLWRCLPTSRHRNGGYLQLRPLWWRWLSPAVRCTRAAREENASWRFTPTDIAAVARLLADYNYKRAWPQGAEADQKIEWLSIGHGCVERFGTVRDAHIAAWRALEAAMSILADVPLEHSEDAEALLETLTYTGWRHLPCHQQPRVARRMSRFVTDRIMGLPFVPTIGGAR
jgi:hypothetical protein